MLITFFGYLFSASVYLALFYGLYRLLYHRLTFHTWNRALILGMVSFALLAPLFPATGTFLGHTPRTFATGPILGVHAFINGAGDFITGAGNAHGANTGQTDGRFNRLTWAGLLYLAGLLTALIVSCRNIRQLGRILRAGPMEKIPGFRLIRAAPVNASFFRTIFLRNDLEEAETAAVLLHEQYHAVKWHSLDNIFMELLKVIFWFHPLVYRFHRLLREQHEFEVDACMTRQMDPKQYAHLLLQLSTSAHLPLINEYSVSPLTKRIYFLFKTPHTAMKKTMYLLLIPCAALSVILFTPYAHAQQIQDVVIRDVVLSDMDVIDVGPVVSKGVFFKDDSNGTTMVISLQEIIGKDLSYEKFDQFLTNIYPPMAEAFIRKGWNLNYNVVQGPENTLQTLGFGLTRTHASSHSASTTATWRVKEVVDGNDLIMCSTDKKSRWVRTVSFTPAEAKKYLGYDLPAAF